MKQFILLSVMLLLITLFSACTTSKSLTYTEVGSIQDGLRTKETKIEYINYSVLADEAIKSIFSKVKLPKKIIVTDFVDVTSLDNHVRLGYVLSNNVKNSLINNSNINVVEAEVSKYFKISGNGIKILSRDVDKLRSTNFDVRYAVVGTYTYSSNELIIFVKLIDLKTGIIEGSYAHTFLMGHGTRMMLNTK